MDAIIKLADDVNNDGIKSDNGNKNLTTTKASTMAAMTRTKATMVTIAMVTSKVTTTATTMTMETTVTMPSRRGQQHYCDNGKGFAPLPSSLTSSPVAPSPASSRSLPAVPLPSLLTLSSVASSSSLSALYPGDPARYYLSRQSRKNLHTSTFSWVMIVT